MNEYQYKFKEALNNYINSKGFRIQNIKYEYPRLIMPTNKVMLHYRHNQFYSGDKNTTRIFQYGEIPDFSFIQSNLDYLEIPIPDNQDHLLGIMEELSSLNITYTLCRDVDYEYSMGVKSEDLNFFKNYVTEHKFKVSTFHGPMKQIFFDSIDDLKMSMLHLTIGKEKIEFVTRRIPK